MSVKLSPDELRPELDRRGWRYEDFAKATGLTMMTIGNALAGKPVATSSARAIHAAFEAHPPILDGLLEQPA